jgi:hypothetical protein
LFHGATPTRGKNNVIDSHTNVSQSGQIHIAIKGRFLNALFYFDKGDRLICKRLIEHATGVLGDKAPFSDDTRWEERPCV